MRLYTGIDIVENKRIENALKRYGDTFLRKIFTEREIGYCKNKKNDDRMFFCKVCRKRGVYKSLLPGFWKKIKI